jgi:hypothetical protein
VRNVEKTDPDLRARMPMWWLLILLLAGVHGFSQKPSSSIMRRGDSLFFIDRNICKGFFLQWCLLDNSQQVIASKEALSSPTQQATARQPFLRIQGNVQYDFLYRSYVDTPFSQHGFQQHTIQTFLTVTVKDKYPLKVNLSKRISNSPFFRDFLDVNLRFDKHTFVRNAKQHLIDRISSRYLQQPDLTRAEAALQQAIEKFNQLKAALQAPDVLQRIVEEREQQYYKSITPAAGTPEMPWQLIEDKMLYRTTVKQAVPENDHLPANHQYTQQVEQKKKALDSLQQQISGLQTKADSIKNRINNNLVAIRRKVYQAANANELRKIEKENGIIHNDREGLERFLSNVRTVGIGRSVVNYSELTAWNVALTGFNMEYNDGLYAALAAGKIDYGFRDFMGKNTRQKGQQFIMSRIGWGDVDRKAIILSAFGGRKYNYGSIAGDTVKDYINIAGYSLEGILKKDENNFISAEIAKTTQPVTGTLGSNRGIQSLFNFADNANLGVHVKAQTLFKKTNTRINGFYRATGQQFQSFSLFIYNTNQKAWQVGIDQPFWNDRITVTGSLRQNDFTNPLSEKTFKTSTIFKSIQLQVRIPRWPVFSAGYHPGSQLYIVDKERVKENAYYILNASVVHHYSAAGIRMLSSLLYNRYAGKGTDSGFIAYSGINYMASHAFIFQKLQVQGSYMYTSQEQMQYYTLEADGDYSITKWLRVGGAVKQNKITGGNHYLGSSARIGLEWKTVGGLQLQYEKSYLPTIWQTLYPVETGRVTWFKYF